MTHEYLRYLPPGFDVPTDELQALKAARAIIAEDGRWCQGSEFETTAPVNGKGPYCGDWQVCAVGAVRLVTLGVEARDHALTHEKFWDIHFDRERTPEMKLYESTCNRLHEATERYTSGKGAEAALYETGEYEYHPIFDSVVDKNDDTETKLDEMLDIFDLAIELLEARENEAT